MNGWWITGLTDGEGSFYARVDRRSGKGAVRPCFAISLVEADAPCLMKVRDYLGVGRIQYWKDKRPNAQNKACYRVESFKEFQRIIKHFEEYPLGSKKIRDFRLWKEVINSYRSGDKDKAFILVDELKALHRPCIRR